MASLKGFGQRLHDARVSSGLTYGTVSRNLRIRVDLLQAIEEEDFTTMPPRSYARGMVHAYAAYLGLNADAVTEDYLQALAAYERNNAPRRKSRQASVPASLSAEVSPDDLERLYQEDTNDAARERLRRRRERRAQEGRSSAAGHTQQNARQSTQQPNPRTSRSRGSSSSRNQNSSSSAAQRPSANHRTDASASSRQQTHGNVLGVAGSVFARAADTVAGTVGGALSPHKNIDINHSIYADRNNTKRFTHNQNIQAGARFRSQQQSIMSASAYGVNENRFKINKLPFLVAIIVILMLLIIAANTLFGKPSASQEDTQAQASSSSSVAISGLNDPGSAGTVEKETSVVPVAPTAAVFTYDISDGEDCYLEIYLDNASTPTVAGTYTGPKRGTYDVTGTLSFVTSRPGVVTLKVDGKTVEPQDDNNDGVYTYLVDFSEILAAWKEVNGQSSES